MGSIHASKPYILIATQKWKRLLHRCRLQPGHAVDLGTVWLRQDAAVATRVVGIWAKGQREPWWLATSRDDSLSFLASLYDRRMAMEEQIRDTKGARFGLQLVWTQIKTPQALARFTLLIGLALLLLTAIGNALALRHPKIRLPSKRKGPRLSLLSVGRLFFLSFLQNQILSTRFLTQNIPKPTLRSFEWIDTQTYQETQK